MKVVISGYCWLDVNELTEGQKANLRRVLTVHPRKTTDIVSKEEPKPIKLYKEDDRRGLFGVPRAFYDRHKKRENQEILKVSYGEPMSDEMLAGSNYRCDGPYKEQEDAIRKLLSLTEDRKYGGFILNAGCAFGKTYSAIEFARRLGLRTLIIVHKEFLLKQWIDSIKDLCPRVRIGIIQQNKCQYKDRDFVIGMIHSLSKSEKYPDEVYKAFGTVIVDECHHVPAHTFAPVVPMFNAAYRCGLSATPRRIDGAEDVFFQHIGKIEYSARTISPVPKVRRIFTDSKLKAISRGKYKVSIDKLNSAQIVSQLASDKFRTRQIVEDIVEAVVIGKKVMIVSDRLHHLKDMAKDLNSILVNIELPFIPVIDFYTGEWFTGEVYSETVRGKTGKILHKRGELKRATRKAEDLLRAEKANVLFVTKQLCEEGFNVPSLDIVVLSTPISNAEQVVGRVRRWCVPDGNREKCKHLCSWRWETCQGKPQPMVVDIIDENVKLAMNRWKRYRRPFYRKIGAL